MKTKDTKRKTRTGAARRIGALFLALTMTFGTWTPAFAEEPAPGIEEHVEIPAEETEKGTPEVQETPAQDKAEADGLDIGPEIVQEAVGESTVTTPEIEKAFIGTKEVSGKGLAKARINNTLVCATVYVTVTGSDEQKKADGSVTPKRGTTWKVSLGVELAEGDTITVYQELNGAKSESATTKAMQSKAIENQDKLKMPTGEIWIEDPSSNLVNDDEQKEARSMFDNVNTAIATDIKSVKFTIVGTDHAYYEVTYKDGSTSGKVEAKDLTIKPVTETSAAPTIEKVQVADNKITVTLNEVPAKGTKFYFAKTIDAREYNIFCPDGDCKFTKTTFQEMTQAVSIDGKTVTFKVKDTDLELGKEFGIVVKEPHKFRSCAKSKPVLGIPDKVGVRDPKNLTDTEKDKIREAIRKANTTESGVSKMPNGTASGMNGMPAFIEFDKDGNVRIFSPNDVEVDWDSNFDPIFQKNPDGTYKRKADAKVYEFAAKDLVKNLAPEKPTFELKADIGKIYVYPPVYEGDGKDTDLISYKLTYKDKDGNDKTVTATRDLNAETNAWSLTEGSEGEEIGIMLNKGTGEFWLDVNKLEVGGTLTATAKDNGGLEGDTDKLDSDEASKTLETAKVTYQPGEYKAEGSEEPAVPGTVDDQNPMKDDEVNRGGKFKLAKKCTFKAPENTTFAGWKIGNDEYLVKETDEDGNHTYYKKGDENKTPVTELKITENIEATALWNPVFTVTFNMNGHGTAPADQKIVKDGTANEPTAPTADGWTFGGWYTDEKLTSKYDFNSPVKESFTLYAKWTKNATPPAPGGDDKPGTTPGGNTPGTHPNDPQNPGTPGTPGQPGDPHNPNKPGDPNHPNKPNDPKDPSAPWGKGNTDIDALLRRMKALRNDPAVRKILEGQRVIPKAGVGASTTAVEPVLFPVDLLPAPKKREEE